MSAIKAVFVDAFRVPTRKTLKIILECPEENQKEVYDILGYPSSDKSIWVGVARLTEDAALMERPAFLNNVEEA